MSVISKLLMPVAAASLVLAGGRALAAEPAAAPDAKVAPKGDRAPASTPPSWKNWRTRSANTASFSR